MTRNSVRRIAIGLMSERSIVDRRLDIVDGELAHPGMQRQGGVAGSVACSAVIAVVAAHDVTYRWSGARP